MLEDGGIKLDSVASDVPAQEKADTKRQKTLERELEWVRMSPRARQSKSKARLQAYEQLASEAQQEKIVQNEIVIPPAPRLGNDVVVTQDLKKGFGDKLLIEDLSFSLPRAGIVGIIGPNGAGKSTLFRMITGKEKPDSGKIKVGKTVKLGHVDQSPQGRSGPAGTVAPPRRRGRPARRRVPPGSAAVAGSPRWSR